MATSDVLVLDAVGVGVVVSVTVGSSLSESVAVGVGSLGVLVGVGVWVPSAGDALVASGSSTGVVTPEDCSPSTATVMVGDGIAVAVAG